jgi:phosphate starvation-inducible PhoH-like protein
LSKPKKKLQRKKSNSVVNFNDAVKAKARETHLIPKSVNQEKYIISLLDDTQDIVIAHGPAGTGKTYLAMQAAIKQLRNGTIERIVLTRPAVGVEDEKHGFLPGTLEEKMAPWTRPLLDVMREYYSTPEITKMLENQIVEIAPLAFMRGRTFKDSWIIGDEMQNATPGQMKMLLTRIGEGSKIVITGDIEQTDKRKKDNGLIDLCGRLGKSVEGITTCELDTRDIQRHRIIASVLGMYSDVS